MQKPNEADVIRDHLANSESTHNTATTASAARLIRLLRQAYPLAQRDELLGAKQLKTYLDHPEYGQAFDSALIARLTTYVQQLLHFGQDHWTQNAIYDSASQQIVNVDASLGEVFNLVCLALFDSLSYAQESRTPKDTRHRIDSLIICLDQLQQNPRMCSGGIQHDLLFLLNDCWRQFHAIENVDAFLHETLMEKIIQQNPPFNVLDAWVRRTCNVENDDHTTLLDAWLETIRPALSAPLLAACQEHGLNPTDLSLIQKITTLVMYINALNVPTSIPGVPLMVDLRKTKPLLQTPHDPLLAARNNAITKAHARLNTLTATKDTSTATIEKDQTLIDIMRAERVWQSLQRYLNGSFFIGEEGGNLQASILRLQTCLYHFWQTYDQDFSQLPDDFDALKTQFRDAERLFLDKSHVDWIKNCFALLQQSGVLTPNDWMAHLHMLHASHSLALSDNMIHTWLQGHEGIVDIGPYEINRFLLHALLVHPNQWTPIFQIASQTIILWLQEPESQPTWNGIALRSTYPERLLANIRFVLLMQNSDLTTLVKQSCYDYFKNQELSHDTFIGWFERVKRQYRIQIFTKVQTELKWLLINQSHTYYLLKTPELTAQNRRDILIAMHNRLSTQIENTNELIDFLNIIYLTDENRTTILNAVMNHLSLIIQNNNELSRLLEIISLTDEQRTLILTAVQSKLHKLAYSMNQLRDLIKIPFLTKEQRELILTHVKDHLVDIIRFASSSTVIDFIAIPYLTENQRTTILSTLKGSLLGIIGNGTYLRKLLDLPCLTENHRTQIWNAVENGLLILLTNPYCLQQILDCPSLTDEQRKTIWGSVENHLTHVITPVLAVVQTPFHISSVDNNTFLLRNLLQSPHLTENQRTDILQAIKGRLPCLIKTDAALTYLLTCPMLTTNHRAMISHAMGQETSISQLTLS